MPGFESLIKLLQNDNPNKRYEACEELRVSQQPLSQEAIDALNFATNDSNPDVADAAQRALALHTQISNEPELGQEQYKAFTVADSPKTKFDKLFERRSSGTLLFIGALIIALIVAVVISRCDIIEILIYFPVSLLISIAFYAGGEFTLVILIWALFGWIFYIVTILGGIRSRSKVLFGIFATSLFLSLLGYILALFGGYSIC